jgi:hypothetical protein
MVLAMCPPDNCACSKDQEPAAIGQEQADRHIPNDAECPHLTRLFSERFQDKPLVNLLGCRLLRLNQAAHLFNAPHVILHDCLHCWRYAGGLMHPAKIVVASGSSWECRLNAHLWPFQLRFAQL